MANHSRFIVSLAAFSLLGCQASGPAVGGIAAWQDVVLPSQAQALQSSALSLTIRRKPQAGYRVNYIRDLDWELAEATLTNADATIPVLNRSSTATVGADNARTATLLFSPIKPASNYTLALNLKKKQPDGVTYKTVASGTSTGVTLTTGANSVNVTLTPTAQGELLVDVSDPTLVINTLTTQVDTDSHFSVARVAGDATGGNNLGTTPTTAAFKEIAGLDLDASGAVYVADAGNHQVRKIPTSGANVLVAGDAAGTSGATGDGGLGTAAKLNQPRGLTRDPASGNLVFCDSGNNRVRTIAATDGKIYTLAGGGADTGNTVAYAVNAQLSTPYGVAADGSGNLFVTERGTGRVLRIAVDGTLTTLATLTANTLGPIAIDRTNNLLWVGHGDAVRVITGINGGSPALSATTLFSATGASSPVVTGLAFDQIGTLYVSQTGSSGTFGATNTRIYRVPVNNVGQLHATRVAEVIAGTGGSSGTPGDYAPSTTPVTNAVNQLLGGASWCSLALDMSAGNTAGTLSGQLYFGNSYTGSWGNVLKLEASAL